MVKRLNVPMPSVAGTNLRTHGTCLVRFSVDENGTPQDVRVSDCNPVLEETSLHAAKSWRFEPVVQTESPIAVEFSIKFDYTWRSMSRRYEWSIDWDGLD